LNENNCCLLIGNSRLHWAIKKLGKWRFIHTLPNSQEITNYQKGICKWAAVGTIPENLELDPKKQITLQDIPLKNAPQWLGIDRALGSWGAFEQAKKKGIHSKGIILADAGTVLSLTCVSHLGEFIGGQLIAGLNLQRLAMAQKTQNLIYPKNNYLPSKVFPVSTEEAILRGTYQSLIGTIIEAQKISKMPLWLCGGDSKIIFENLKSRLTITYCPNITLEAMIKIKS